ncbi:MAG: RND family efflux transporter MFP subunit, macrolide-specific efflux protein MacA, partial [Candidatus Peregrinibacteria bacterium GW2011_GWE2_39_6]
LTAPTSGVVTQINGEVGENVSQSEDFLVMISDQLQIVANVSETDIGKVKLGNKVALTLDAFSFDQLFEAEIIKIDPAETVIQGVIYYQVTAMFDKQDNTLIKPGMTANMAIITAQKDHVLAIPIRAVKYDEARTYVLIQNSVAGGEPIEVDVTLGIRGDQYVEILSGLKENDKVITYLK